MDISSKFSPHEIVITPTEELITGLNIEISVDHPTTKGFGRRWLGFLHTIHYCNVSIDRDNFSDIGFRAYSTVISADGQYNKNYCRKLCSNLTDISNLYRVDNIGYWLTCLVNGVNLRHPPIERPKNDEKIMSTSNFSLKKKLLRIFGG